MAKIGRPKGSYRPDWEWFWKQFSSQSFSECWIWQGNTNNGGYGHIWWCGKTRLVHRIVWEDWWGTIPPGKEVCHDCDTPPCGNPYHLFLGTHQDNMRDFIWKGRGMLVQYTGK